MQATGNGRVPRRPMLVLSAGETAPVVSFILRRPASVRKKFSGRTRPAAEPQQPGGPYAQGAVTLSGLPGPGASRIPTGES